MKPQGILETAVYCSDLEKALEFYNSIIGLKVISLMKNRHVFFRCGSGVFLVFNPAETKQSSQGENQIPAHGTKGPGHMAFSISETEVEKWRNHLKDNNVPIEAEIQWPQGGHSLYIRDPDGNSIELATPEIWLET